VVSDIIQTDIATFDIEFSLNQKVGDVILEPTDMAPQIAGPTELRLR
jgi:hypothetical protein